MAKKTLEHKGYHGTIEVKTDDFSLFGSILFIDEKHPYKGETFEELEESFRIEVEKHIDGCLSKGVPIPFKEKQKKT